MHIMKKVSFFISFLVTKYCGVRLLSFIYRIHKEYLRCVYVNCVVVSVYKDKTSNNFVYCSCTVHNIFIVKFI